MNSKHISEYDIKPLIETAIKKHKLGQWDEAKSLYKQVLQIQSEYGGESDSLKDKYQMPQNFSEALYGLGMLAQQTGEFLEAEKFLSQAAQVQPNSVKTWFSLGNLRQVQGQLAQAESAYKQAIALRPDAAPIYNNLGYTLEQQGKLDEAVVCYQKALELQPNCTEADANLGNLLHTQGKLPSDRQAYYAQLNYKLGCGRKNVGDLKTAVAYHQQAMSATGYAYALQPDFLEAHYNLGLALQEQGELEEAIASYQNLLEINPNYGEAYLSLGKIYQQQNQYQKAVSAYRQGLKLINPHYAKALAAYQGSETTQEVPMTPQFPQEEVIVGRHRFLAIPPVVHDRKRPFWSIVLPIYSTNNRNNYLLEALVSVLRQWSGEEEMEIVVVDDASPVPLKYLVDEIGQGIIRYYRNNQNRGAYQNFNIAVTISQGQWIHLLHDDDYVLPGFYHHLRHSLETCSPSIGAAFTGYENVNEQGKVVFSQQVYGDKRGIIKDFIELIGVANPLNMPAVVVRRSTYEHLGGYLPELNYTGDWEFYKRVTAFYDWWYEPEILARYRQHTHNITTESILSGTQGRCLRRAIEISEDYIPVEITTKSRSHNFNYCLSQASIPLQFDKVEGALRMIEEALKIDRSSGAVAKLFTWLQQDEAALLRDEIASRLISLPLNKAVAKS